MSEGFGGRHRDDGVSPDGVGLSPTVEPESSLAGSAASIPDAVAEDIGALRQYVDGLRPLSGIVERRAERTERAPHPGRPDAGSDWFAVNVDCDGNELVMIRADELQRLQKAAREAHDGLIELNPNNYTHDDVCEANDAAVEAILLLADALGETHGKTPDWWAARRAALAKASAA